MKATLLNIHNFHSKAKNKDYSIITVLRDISPREREQGYLGQSISEEIFLPDNLVNVLTNTDIGKELDVVYDVYGGKANVVDVQILGKGAN